MGKHKNDFYGYIKKRIMQYPKIEEEETLVGVMQATAIRQELEALEADGNEAKVKAVKLVLFDKTHTVEGAALKVNYSYRSVQNWINDFINNVGKRAGF